MRMQNRIASSDGCIWQTPDRVMTMKEIILKPKDGNGIEDKELRGILEESISECRADLKKVLLVPPDFTRMHSGAGRITALYYEMLKDSCHIDIMPALGTHEPMEPSEIDDFGGTFRMTLSLTTTGGLMW